MKITTAKHPPKYYISARGEVVCKRTTPTTLVMIGCYRSSGHVCYRYDKYALSEAEVPRYLDSMTPCGEAEFIRMVQIWSEHLLKIKQAVENDKR